MKKITFLMSFILLLSWHAMAQPANDDISGAIPLTLGAGSCSAPLSGTNVAATNSGTAHTCASYQGGDVWYYVVVPSGGTFSVETSTNGGFTDGGMQAYSGPSNALVSINCDDDDSPSGLMPGIYPLDGLTGLTPNDTIWFAVWEYGNNATGTFEICAWEPPPAPANDDISGAIPLTLGSGTCSAPLSGTNVGATNSGTAHTCASYQGGDVWYYVVVPSGGIFTVETSTNGGFTDGGMQAYSGPSNALVSINCDDDDGPGSMAGIYPLDGLTGLTPGDTIWFAVWEYGNNATGTFEICAWEPPTCLAPTALTVSNVTTTTADLGWTNPTGSLWHIEWDTAGFTPGTGNFVTGTTNNPYSLLGLTPQTAYEFYVISDCGIDSSAWVGPFAFSTACPSVVAPWNEGFENAGTIPACWNQGVSNSENWMFTNTGSGNHIGNNGVMGGASTSGNYFAWIDDSTPDNTGTTLESPFIDVSSLTNTTLSFFLISNNEGNSNVDFSVDVWDGAAWNVGFYTHNTNTVNGEWEEITVNLSTLTITGDIQLRFIADEPSNGDFYDDVAIDDVRIYEPLTNDIGVIAIESAPAGCGLGNETVTIKIKNYGLTAETGFDVVYALNSVAITPETISSTVNPGDTLTYVFTTLANMSTPAVYTIDAWTDLTTDGDNNNDTLNGWMTEHIASSLAFSGTMAIPDNNATGINSIICTNGLVNNMLDSCYTLSALVIDSLVHSWETDIDMWLISPAGDTLEVSTDNGSGSGSDGYINVTFTDTASINPVGITNLNNGFFNTEEAAGLAKFMGTNPNGAWTLLVKDDLGGDTGVLYDWHLEFTDYNFTVDLGTDTNICSVDPITLNAGAGNYSYSWSTGDNTQQVTLDTNTLGGNGTYNIFVTVTDTISGCQSIDTIVVNYTTCTGINALANNVNVNVYPNPNNGQFTLNVNTSDVNELSIRVVNIQGQEVYNRNNFENLNTVNEKIDLSNNANGIYFVIVTTDKGIVTHKMIVQ